MLFVRIPVLVLICAVFVYALTKHLDGFAAVLAVVGVVNLAFLPFDWRRFSRGRGRAAQGKAA